MEVRVFSNTYKRKEVFYVQTRMIYTGYFANLKKYKQNGLQTVSVARFNPSWYNGVSFSELSPSDKLLGDYKLAGISEEEYAERYKEEITRPSSRMMIEKLKEKALTGTKDMVLLCYEKPDEFCHRHILAEVLNEEYPEIFHIEEF